MPGGVAFSVKSCRLPGSSLTARPKTPSKGVIALGVAGQPDPKHFKKVLGLAAQPDPSILGLAAQPCLRVLGRALQPHPRILMRLFLYSTKIG